MKTLLHLVLLFGAMFGLFGQSTAMAMAPVAGVPMTAMADMGSRADMTDGSRQDHRDLPCKKLTLQCIAAMGCAPAAIVLPTFTAETAPRAVRFPYVLQIVAAMLGRSVAPAQDPPAFLI